jgi:hypothetical protein
MTWTPLINVIGTIAATIMAYNISTGITEKLVYPSYMQYVPTMARKFAKKVMMAQSVIEMILLVPLMILILWAFNTLVLQTNILWECNKINWDTWHIAAINALSGAISCSIILLVWNILTLIPILKFLIILESFYIIPILMLIFNLSFGAGLGNALALKDACSVPATPPTTPQPPNVDYLALTLYGVIVLSPFVLQYILSPKKRSLVKPHMQSQQQYPMQMQAYNPYQMQGYQQPMYYPQQQQAYYPQ